MQPQITTIPTPTAEQAWHKTTLSNPLYGGRPTCECNMWVEYGRCRHIAEMKGAKQ